MWSLPIHHMPLLQVKNQLRFDTGALANTASSQIRVYTAAHIFAESIIILLSVCWCYTHLCVQRTISLKLENYSRQYVVAKQNFNSTYLHWYQSMYISYLRWSTTTFTYRQVSCYDSTIPRLCAFYWNET